MVDALRNTQGICLQRGWGFALPQGECDPHESGDAEADDDMDEGW